MIGPRADATSAGDHDDEPRAVAVLKVASISRSLVWYRAAGFSVRGTFPADDPSWAEVGRDDLVLQLLAGDTPWPDSPAFTGCFYVHPPSVSAVYESVHLVIPIEWGVESRPWGAIELTVRDPDGYFITFSEAAT